MSKTQKTLKVLGLIVYYVTVVTGFVLAREQLELNTVIGLFLIFFTLDFKSAYVTNARFKKIEEKTNGDS